MKQIVRALHIQITHENKRPFACSKCNRSFDKEDELFIHFCNNMIAIKT
jgi:hypothetical protein